jgi:ribosomal protein S12 methylthiotransferase accessory factor YcaO
MSKVSVRVPEDLKESMDKHRKINWSEIARKAFREELKKIELADSIASKSELDAEDAEELGEKVKEGIADRHGLE